MTDRPKWMPSRESLLSMCHNESLYDSCEYDYAGEEVEDSHYRTGLRAQIAVLEESPVAFVEVDGKSHLCVDHLLWVKNKIAAIRKELASE